MKKIVFHHPLFGETTLSISPVYLGEIMSEDTLEGILQITFDNDTTREWHIMGPMNKELQNALNSVEIAKANVRNIIERIMKP